MHELTLATEIVNTALRAAPDGCAAIDVVHLTMGTDGHLDEGRLNDAFAMAAAGTPAAGARLNVEHGESPELAVTAIDVKL